MVKEGYSASEMSTYCPYINDNTMRPWPKDGLYPSQKIMPLQDFIRHIHEKVKNGQIS